MVRIHLAVLNAARQLSHKPRFQAVQNSESCYFLSILKGMHILDCHASKEPVVLNTAPLQPSHAGVKTIKLRNVSCALTATMTEHLQTQIFSIPGWPTKLTTNPILISLVLNTLIVISSMALPDHGSHTLWIGTIAAIFTYTHHFVVLYLNRKYQRTLKKFRVMSTLWCIITLFLIGVLWLAAIAFEFLLGLKYLRRRPAVQAFGYVVELLSTLVEAGIIFFLGYICIRERKHAKRAYEGSWNSLHSTNTVDGS
ncbi:hypothetical protein IW262DRAFT_1354635 [Armillaria fumosa]|nr:hypothetical protein IW262DRAFT_1354635 [Armillaria fumosa]